MAKKRILIVDDEPQLAKMLEIRLSANGYDVLLAHDGEEGVRKARVENPDLILLDIMLPKMDGFAVCRQIRNDVATHSIPILMLSVKVDGVDKDWAKASGANDYQEKPFEAETLLAKIKKLLDAA